jgi:hypothetical protein
MYEHPLVGGQDDGHECLDDLKSDLRRGRLGV